MDFLAAYGHAQHLFTEAVRSLGDDPWHRETACHEWNVGDIVGHVTWGQDLIRSLADGSDFDGGIGAPGSASPAAYVGTNPMAAWLRAKDAAARTLTSDRLGTPLPPDRFGEGATLGGFAETLEFDLIAHAWDITRPHGIEQDVPADQIARISRTAERVVTRRPGFFAPEVETSTEADQLTRLMLFCGRSITRH